MPVDAIDVGRVAAIGFVVTMAVSPIVLKVLLHKQVMDIPSARSSHLAATPRGGGLACLVGLAAAVGFAPVLGAGSKLLLLMSGGALAALGFADDLRSRRVRVRLGVQIVVAVVASCCAFHLSWTTSLGAVALAAVGAIWIVAYINAYNFMDGINGLAGAATAVSGVTFVVVGLASQVAGLAMVGAAMASAALAFLPWNFPHARFFLGDVGSYLFGGTTAIAVLIGLHARIPLEALLGPELVFLADTGWTLAKRVSRGEDWASAHRSHVYQRLQGMGRSHGGTTIVVIGFVIGLSALGLVSLTDLFWGRLIADVAGAILVVGYLASPRVVRRKLELQR